MSAAKTAPRRLTREVAAFVSPSLARWLRSHKRHGLGLGVSRSFSWSGWLSESPRAPSSRGAPATVERVADASAPLPLDDALPAAGPRRDPLAYVSAHRRGVLWIIGGTALALRLLLLPLGHPWDITTMYNMFVDLGHTHSPYATFRYLTDVARAAMWRQYYEYYTYPPAPIYLYFPLAKVFLWLHPHADYFFPVPGRFAMPSLSWDFYALYKAPIWLADFGIAAALARMTGTIRSWRGYLLNPYVLLISGAWTFDAVMVFALVLGVYWLQRSRLGWAGVSLAVGTMVKFVPAFIVPTCALYLIKRRRTPREVALFLASYMAACLAMAAPFVRGLLDAVGFQSARNGGGMNFQVLWTLWRLFPGQNTAPTLYALAAFGTLTLVIALLLAYWYTYMAEMSLNRMVLVTLLAYLLGTKLVNEQYVLAIVPFTLIEALRMGGVWRRYHAAVWITALAFAIMHVPIDHFLWPLYHTLFGARADIIATTGLTGFQSHVFLWNDSDIQPLVVLALALWFSMLCALGIWLAGRPAVRASRGAEPESDASAAGTAVARAVERHDPPAAEPAGAAI
jgi:hypothetical protein